MARPIPLVLSKPNLQQNIDQQHTFDNLEEKLQAKSALKFIENCSKCMFRTTHELDVKNNL